MLYFHGNRDYISMATVTIMTFWILVTYEKKNNDKAYYKEMHYYSRNEFLIGSLLQKCAVLDL